MSKMVIDLENLSVYTLPIYQKIHFQNVTHRQKVYLRFRRKVFQSKL